MVLSRQEVSALLKAQLAHSGFLRLVELLAPDPE